jgi:hypothetical protein
MMGASIVTFTSCKYVGEIIATGDGPDRVQVGAGFDDTPIEVDGVVVATDIFQRHGDATGKRLRACDRQRRRARVQGKKLLVILR